MRQKKSSVARVLAVAISLPLICAQPMGVMAQTASLQEAAGNGEDGVEIKKEKVEEETVTENPSVQVATPGNAEYVEDEEILNPDDSEEEEQNEEEREELETGQEKIEEETEPEISDKSDSVPTATPSEAAVASPSNAIMTEPMLLSSGSIWDGFTMSSELSGEGTKEAPYLIKNENDLKYVAYYTAEGNVDGFSGCYFKMTTDITLSSGASWIPIGYFWNDGDSAPEPFKGTFDGGGHKIKNLNISNSAQIYAGLFGQTMDAEITDLTVSAAISAGNLCGGIVGEANETVISGCQVSGTVKAAGVAGGITGECYDAVINDCTNTAIVYAAVPSDVQEGQVVAAGGIAGSAHASRILNCSNMSTESATSVYAEGYVGGIAGNIMATEIYNSYVSGKIGSINAEAIGGIVGRLETGKIKVARMEGVIGKSTSSGLKWAGLYVGYIVSNSIELGPDKDLAYLYTDDESVYALNPFGNMLNGLIRTDHHIGAYSSTNTVSLYCPVATPKFSQLADTYFYEELEDGVLEVEDEDVYHWAPSRTGVPVRGYRVTVPSIDHGTLSIIEAQNPFSKELNWANTGAIASGRKVIVYAEPQNITDADVPVYYELVPDSLKWFEDGGDDYGLIRTDGSEVSFQMPERNITLTAEYRAKTNGVVLDKTELHYEVEQIRSGSRWEPTVAWRVTDPQKLTASILPDSAANKDVSWNVKDTDGSYTDVIQIDGNGIVSVNKNAEWIADLAASAVSNQLNLYPSKPISLEATNYASATVTALANGNRASCLVTVDFKITDNTVVPVESVSLNESSINFEIERTLSGNRLNPTVTIQATPSKRLYATVTPAYSTNHEVTFSSSDGIADMDMITVTQDGLVGVNAEARWIADLLSAEESSRKNNPFLPYNASSNRATYVTATTADGNKSAVCAVNVTFKTVDQTIVHAEHIELDQRVLNFTVDVKKSGNRNNPAVSVDVSQPQKLSAVVLPDETFDKAVTYQTDQTDLMVVDKEGNVSINPAAAWITQLISQNTASANTEAMVSAKTVDGGLTANCTVKVEFKLTDTTYSSGSGGSSGGGGGGGGSSSSGGPKGSAAAGGPAATGTWEPTQDNQIWKYRHTDGSYAVNQWEQAAYNGAIEWYFFNEKGEMATGWYTDTNGLTFYLNPVSDGSRGKMVTGWSQIEGKWYYFNEKSDGNKGALLKDTITPDHYKVGKDGVWIPG